MAGIDSIASGGGPEAIQAEYAVLVQKKAQEAVKQAGEGAVQLIQAADPNKGQNVDLYV